MDKHDTHAEHGAGEAHEHDHDTTKYWWVFGWLCALTSMSFITMRFFGDTPSIGWTIMMAVSSAKAMLVICFFMHLIWEANWKYVLTIPAALMSIFLVLMLVPDVGLRTSHYTEERWLYAAEPPADHHDEGDHHGDQPHAPGHQGHGAGHDGHGHGH